MERSRLRKRDGSLLTGNILGLTARLAGKQDLSITDFGGATGDLGADFLAAFPAGSYTVVENPTLVSLMSNQGPVRFATEIPGRCDIFYSSSCLQYLVDPVGVLADGFASAKLAVVLVRNSFSDAERFYVQRSRLFDNGGGPLPEGFENCWISYPHRTLVEQDVAALAASQGFRCIARLEEPKTFPRSYSKQLVFWRS
jgi:putative methyltransferase (TIGR04325 family)